MKVENSGVLVELNISTWSAQKLDRKATDKVTQEANASKKAGKFTKDLFLGSPYASDIISIAGTTRNWNIYSTMPWKDKGGSKKGPRYCAAELFMPYKQDINGRKSEFWAKIKVLEQNYDKGKNIAYRELGKLYNPDDYPHIDVVLAKYGWHFSVTPIPLSGHFAVDMPKEDLAEFTANQEQNMKGIMKAGEERLRGACTTISKKLVDGKRFHPDFLTGPQELCQFLTHFNITSDPALEDARKKLEICLTGVDLDDIKKFPDARKELKDKVDAIFGAPTPTVSATTYINNPPHDVGTLQDLLTDVADEQPVPRHGGAWNSKEVNPVDDELETLSDW